MVEIERKAQELGSEASADRGLYGVICYDIDQSRVPDEALCRAIEQHEAFRKEVSDAIERAEEQGNFGELYHLIILKPVDPLVEALAESDPEPDDEWDYSYQAEKLRGALAKHGGRIVFEGEDG